MNENQHPNLFLRIGYLLRLSSFALIATISVKHVQSQDVEGSLEDLVTYGAGDPNFVLPNQPIEGVVGLSHIHI